MRSAVAMTWTNTSTSSAAGGFDIDRDGFSDFVVGMTASVPILYRGGAAGPTVVAGGLARLTGSRIVGFSDHDGDGRPDFVGVDTSTNPAAILWAGSDGTTNPRAVTCVSRRQERCSTDCWSVETD